jgi:predicted RNA-binding protein associated with RNAse of E/G family
MRKKLVSKTYMREVSDYEMVIINNEDMDYYLCIKKINKINPPFVLHEFDQDIVHIDNGYYIVEYTSKNKLYNARVYLDNNKNIIDYYFDISSENGLEDKIPYYDDLYLDVLYYPNQNDLIEYDDMNELEEALKDKKITQEQFDNAISTAEQLVTEIKNKKNDFINLDVVSIVERYFS